MPDPAAPSTPASTPPGKVDVNGSVDTIYGTNGFAHVGFGSLTFDEAFAAARQRDGKIVIGGFTSAATGSPAFALARLRPDGTLDPQFGNGGVAQTDLGGHDWVRWSEVPGDSPAPRSARQVSEFRACFALLDDPNRLIVIEKDASAHGVSFAHDVGSPGLVTR